MIKTSRDIILLKRKAENGVQQLVDNTKNAYMVLTRRLVEDLVKKDSCTIQAYLRGEFIYLHMNTRPFTFVYKELCEELEDKGFDVVYNDYEEYSSIEVSIKK